LQDAQINELTLKVVINAFAQQVTKKIRMVETVKVNEYD
jgi:hypothetical protein